MPTLLERGTGQGRAVSVPQSQHSKRIPSALGLSRVSHRGRRLLLGCSKGSLHPSAAHDRLEPASGDFSRQHKPLARAEGSLCVCLCPVVPGHGWAPVTSVLKLGAGFWLPCSEMAQPGDGAGHSLPLPVAQTHSQPCALPLSIPACCRGISASHFHKLCKHRGVGQLTHTGGEKCVLLPRVVRLAQSGQAVLGKHRATVPCQCTPRGETLQPLCQQLRAATAWCQLMLLWLPCPPQSQGGPWGSLAERVSLGGRGGPAAQGRMLAAG